MKKSVTITFFKNSGTKLGIQWYPLFGYSQKSSVIYFYYDTILRLKLFIYFVKTHLSCVPKEPKCGYKIIRKQVLNNK